MAKVRNRNVYSEVRSKEFEATTRLSEYTSWTFLHPLTETLWPRFAYRSERVGDWFMDLKGFPYFSFELTLFGSARYVVNGKRFVTQPGDLLIAPPSCDRRSESVNGGRVKRIGLELYGKSLHSVIENLKLNQGLKLTLDYPGDLADRWGTMYELLRERDAGTEGQVSVLCYEMLAELSRHHSAQTEATYPDILHNILRTIHQAPDQNITCRMLADQVYCSEPTLYRLFQSHLQSTPQAYIMAYKMALAKQYIQIGELSHKEIAASLGFRYPSYFSRAYKRYWGFSPKQT